MTVLNTRRGSCREILRETTDTLHRRLHEIPSFLALRAGSISRADYSALLLRLLGLHTPIDERLAALQPMPELAWYHAAAASASRAARLRCDLAALGMAPGAIDAAPRADALLPPLADAATALGCAWVVEGSALGGRLLASRLSADLGLTSMNGGAFFTPLPSQQERWSACCTAVEACGASADRLAPMLAAAEATFAGFAAWMAEPALT
jgi:heme oxygenase